MDKIKKDISDTNKQILKQLTNLYNKLSNNLEQSYYYGQLSGYEEILNWLNSYQNNSNKFIPPEKIANFFKEKGVNSEKMKCEENIKKTANKTNFNYLFYDQTFNINNNINNIHNEHNVYPISVQNAINNININKSISSFNFIFNNDIKSNEENFRFSLFKNSSKLIDESNSLNNNNDNQMYDDLVDEKQMKLSNSLKHNIIPDINLKQRKKK